MKKRILSLLLAVVMVMSFIPPVHVHAADACDHSSVTSWSNNYDGRHRGYCSDCRTYVYKDCTPGGNYVYSSNTQHYRRCTVCNSYVYGNHTAENWTVTGSGSYKQHKGTCKDCGASVSGYCNYSGQPYVTENGQHWQLCSVCKQPDTKADCYSMWGVEPDDKGNHGFVCDTCNQSVTEECDYSKWDQTPTTHAKECSECGHTKTAENHTWAYKKVNSSQHVKYCTVCGYESYNYGFHDNEWKYEDGQHWQKCKDCGAETARTDCSSRWGVEPDGKGNHSFVCDTCNHSVTEECDYSKWNQTPTTHAEKCSECGHTKTAVDHSWTYTPSTSQPGYHTRKCSVCEYSDNRTYQCTSDTWLQNTDSSKDYDHYKKCVDCEGVFATGKHSGTTTNKGTEGHMIACSTCGAGGMKPHELGDWNDSWNGNHYRECTVKGCDYKETGDHGNWTYDQYSSSQHKKTCGECTYSTYEDCDKSYTDNEDGKTHTVICKDCKKTVTDEKHSFDYNTKQCVCGAEKHDHKWELSASGNKITVICTGATGKCEYGKDGGSLTIKADDSTYNGEEKPATVDNKIDTGSYADKTFTVTYYKKNGSGEYVSVSGKPKAAGEYKAEVYSALDSDAVAFVEYEIEKADLQLAVTAEKYEGIYDGQYHGIKVNAPDGVSIEYSRDQENWSAGYYTNKFRDVCEKTTVYYRAKVNSYGGEDNYTSTEASGSSTVEIKPLDLATVLKVTAEDTTFAYSRNEWSNIDNRTVYHSIKLDVDKNQVPSTYDNITVEYSKDDGATWTTQNPSFKNVGEHPVKYRIYVKDYNAADGKNANYIGIEGTKKVTITKAELPITGLVGYHGHYDGSTHYGFGYKDSTSYGDYFTLYWYDYLFKELNYSFSWTDEDGEARTLTVQAGEKPKLTDFPGFTKQNVVEVDYSKDTDASYGTHKVTVTIGSDNYNDKTFDYYVQIGPGGAYSDPNTVPYDGDEHYIKNYIAGRLYAGFGEVYNFGSIKIEYREKGSTEWLPASQEPGQTNVGSKVVEWRVTMDSDQNGKFGEEQNSFGSPEVFIGEDTVTVTPIGLTATANDKTITYGDAPADNGITITGSYVSPDTEAVVDKTNLGYEHEYAQYGSVGSYKITPKGLDAINYTFTYVPGTLTVVQKPVTILIDSSNKITVDESDLVNGDKCKIDTITYYKGEDVVTDITAPGTYTAKVTLTNGNYKPENDVEFTIAAPDTTPPTGNINVTTHNWNSFLTGVTFDIYFKEGKTVTLTADDDTGVASIQYFVSNTEKTLAEVQATTGWNTYTTPFTIIPNQKAVVYAKITDVEGNVAYICSNGMVFDGTAPVIDGVEDGEKYKKDTDFTVKDDNLDKVTVDGKEVKPDKDGNYTIKNDGKKHTIVATDKAGNKTEVTIKMTKAAAAKDDDSPASGDTFNLVFWGAALVLSMAALVLVIVNKRKFFRAGGKYGR